MDFRNNITIEKARETFDKKSLDHWNNRGMGERSENNEWDFFWEQHNNVWDAGEE